jgi:hypothetical protein
MMPLRIPGKYSLHSIAIQGNIFSGRGGNCPGQMNLIGNILHLQFTTEI